MLAKLLAFLGPVEGSLKGVVNFEEFTRVFVSAATAAVLAGTIGVVTAIQADLTNIVEVPTLASVATLLLTQILDVLRRLQHGGNVPG